MGWWPCCCCSSECTVFTETFDGPDLPSTMYSEGDLNTLDGNARTDDFLFLGYQDKPVCSFSASVSVGLSDSSALTIGDMVRIGLWDTIPTVTNEDGVIAEIEYTSSAPYEWTVRLYESDDVKNDMSNGTGTLLGETTFESLPSTLKLCYDGSTGIASIVINATNVISRLVTGVTIDGNMRFGLCLDTVSGSMSFTDVTFSTVSDECDSCPVVCPECCSGSLPDSVDVTVPAGEFVDDECGVCDTLDDATYNATDGAGVLLESCVQATLNDLWEHYPAGYAGGFCNSYIYSSTNLGITCADPTDTVVGAFVIRCGIQKNSADSTCRMVVAIAFGGPQVGSEDCTVDAAAFYASSWESVLDCTTKSWTCAFVDDYYRTNADGDQFCTFNSTSLTVEAV